VPSCGKRIKFDAKIVGDATFRIFKEDFLIFHPVW
jgi:hypothetical protein